MHLAKQLNKSREEILSLSPSELEWWRAYFSMYPFDDERQDYRNAMLCSVIYTANGCKPRKSVKDFMPRFKKAEGLPSKKVLKTKFKDFRNFLKMMKGNTPNAAAKYSNAVNQSQSGPSGIHAGDEQAR